MSRAEEREAKKKRAEMAAEADREALVRHLEEQDAKRQQNLLRKAAREQKRLADAFDPTPTRRRMYDDQMCEKAALVPGPGQYSPRLAIKQSGGTTFSAVPFTTASSSSGAPLADRDAGSLDAYRVKVAGQMPGPASYTPMYGAARGVGGSTFGLAPELLHGKTVPDAHDMSRMVRHLNGLPAPDAYSPRDPMVKNKAFRISTSKVPSGLEQQMSESAKLPGPGTYEIAGALSPGRSTVLGGSGRLKSDLELSMDRASMIPGPGRYDHPSQLRSQGSPRFSKGGSASLIDAIQMEAKTKPGPGTYHRMPTFEEELSMQKYKRDVVKGLIPC